MLISIDKKIILEVMEEATTERKLMRIPIMAGVGAALHSTVGTGVEAALGKDDVLTLDSIGDKALLGAGIGSLFGGINYFKKDGGLGPTALLGQVLYPIKKR